MWDGLVEDKHLTRKGAFVTVVAGVLLVSALLFLALGVVHRIEVQSDEAEYSDKVPSAPGYMDITMKVSSVDMNMGQIEIGMAVLPKGDLANTEGAVTRDIEFAVVSYGVKESGTMAVGEMGDTSAISDIMYGNVSNYPWDSHNVKFAIDVSSKDAAGHQVTVPSRIKLFGSIQGLDIDAKVQGTKTAGARELSITVTRSTVTQVVVIFSIILIWVLIVTVIAMVLHVSVFGHEMQTMMFAFFGTLLFAMTAFRNAMPGTPPMGVLSDYAGFFWGYVVAIVGIGILTVTWVRRLPRGEKHKDGSPPKENKTR